MIIWYYKIFSYNQILKIEDVIELRRLCSEQSDIMQEVGFSKPFSMIEITEKAQIVRAICTHYVLLRCKAELDQLKTGLSTLGLLDELCSNPSLFKPLFTTDAKANLTAGIRGCYHNIHAQHLF